MRENRLSGSEGGATLIPFVPTPIDQSVPPGRSRLRGDRHFSPITNHVSLSRFERGLARLDKTVNNSAGSTGFGR